MNEKYLRYVRQNRKIIGVFIVIFIFLVTLGVFIFHTIDSNFFLKPSNKTVYVAGDGSGNFTCDGSDDQVEINQALEYVTENPEFTTVHLKGPNTYVISNNIFIGNDTTLQGDPTAVIKLKDKANWPQEKPLITQMSSSGNQNITIRGFEINGNYDGNTEKMRGDGYYNLINFFNCDNIQVYDMYMHDSHGDGLRIKDSEKVKFHDNRIYKLGHDGLYAIECQNVEAWGNLVRCKTNSALRIYNSNHVKFHDNIIYTVFEPDAGGPGIQIQYIGESSPYVMDDIEVYNNTIYDTYGPGIWLIAYGQAYAKDEAKNVYIHHNTFYGCGTHPTYDWLGGIVTSGFYDTLIENNVFDGNYHTAVALQAALDLKPPGTGYTTIVRNNIISNTKQQKYQPAGTGNGVVNYLTGTHSFILENNCFYNNTGGDYKNTRSSASDIHVDPLFADQKNHDYHLKSSAGRWNGKTWVKDKVSSPCIDAGYPSSDYSKEPENNGNRINIGGYGNTEYASMSETMSEIIPEYKFLWNQVVSPAWKTFRTISETMSEIIPEYKFLWNQVVSPAWKTFRIILRAFFLILP